MLELNGRLEHTQGHRSIEGWDLAEEDRGSSRLKCSSSQGILQVLGFRLQVGRRKDSLGIG